MNQSHFKPGSGWTDVFPQRREPRANLSTERLTACLKNTIWSSFLLSQIRACGKTTGSSPALMSKERHAAAAPSMQNMGTFFLSHPPNSHTVQARGRTFHTSQKKNGQWMRYPVRMDCFCGLETRYPSTETAAEHYTNYLSCSGDRGIGVWKRSLRKIYTRHFFC